MNAALPIVLRELRVRARRAGTHWLRLIAAAGAMVVVIFMLFTGSTFGSTRAFGGEVFQIVAWIAFAFCLGEGLRTTADCLSEEKRAGTLGLLFLTDLRSHDIVLGKFVAVSLNTLYALLAILPPLGLPLLVGGVSGGEFGRTVLALLNTAFFSLSAGVIVSAASRHERHAWGGAAALLFFAAVLLPLLTHTPTPFASQVAWLESASPTTMLLTLWDDVFAAEPDRFWRSVWCVHILSWAGLLGAVVILPRSWQERVLRQQPGWSARFESSLRRRWSGEMATRKRLVSAGPIEWWVRRKLGPPIFLWLLAALAGVVSGLGGVIAPGQESGLFILCVMQWGILEVMALRVAWDACHQFAEARDSGALELLLCTPLTLIEIVEGHIRGLRRALSPPILAALVCTGVMAIVHTTRTLTGGGGSISWGMTLLVGLLACGIAWTDFYAVVNYGLWRGLRTQKPGQAFAWTVLWVLLVPLLLGTWCVMLWPLAGWIKNLFFVSYGRDQLLRHLRSLTAHETVAAPGPKIGLPPRLRPTRPSDLPSVLATRR